MARASVQGHLGKCDLTGAYNEADFFVPSSFLQLPAGIANRNRSRL